MILTESGMSFLYFTTYDPPKRQPCGPRGLAAQGKQRAIDAHSLSVTLSLSLYIYTYMYIHIYIYISTYMYIWMDWNTDTTRHYYVETILDIL